MTLWFWRQPIILTFLLHKSTATDQIYSNSVSTFTLQSLLLKYQNGKIGLIAAPQQPTTADMFLRHPVQFFEILCELSMFAALDYTAFCQKLDERFTWRI